MKQQISTLMAAALFAVTAASSQAEIRSRSGNIVVGFPSDSPAQAQQRSTAMYLHSTGDGRTLLYLEQNAGKQLAILDVSNAAAPRAVAQVMLPAPSAYDFVQDVGDSAV